MFRGSAEEAHAFWEVYLDRALGYEVVTEEEFWKLAKPIKAAPAVSFDEAVAKRAARNPRKHRILPPVREDEAKKEK